MNRRRFLQSAAGAAGLLALRQKAYGYAVSPRIRKFVTPLRRFGPDIPVLTPDKTTYPGIDYYNVEAGVFRDHLHDDLPNGTRLYGYAARGGEHKHLGGAILAEKDTPVRIKLTSKLPSTHILPFDTTVPQGPMGTYTGPDRAAIHLHGGLVPWPSDGGPFHWVSNADNGGLKVGASLAGAEWLPNAGGAKTNDYFYPNHQSARFMWYHDHAIGTTRTNAYAGIATGYFITDSVEKSLGIPSPGDILVFQDKVFWDPAIDPLYANYVNNSDLQGGDLWYPYIYDPKIWGLAKGGIPIVGASCVAEMFGDTMLVNGTPYPFMNVSGMVRLRMLNACNARFLNLSFALEAASDNGEPRVNSQGVATSAPIDVWQIGTEGGFLPTPVQLVKKGVVLCPLLLGPAERADLIVDFTGVAAGTDILLYNNAPAPYPAGSPLFDFSGQTNNARLGFGPNTRTIMDFRVGLGSGQMFQVPASIPREVLATVPDTANGGLKLAASPGSSVNFEGASYNYVTATQEITLNESFDQYGRLAQLIGNTNSPNGLLGSPYWDGPGEQVKYGTIQIWNVYNLTADAHPMHVHLFNAMILRRRPIKVNQFNGNPVFTALGRGPDPNEMGWKETFKMYPGECTTLAVLVEDPFFLPDPGTGVHGSNSTTRTYTFKNAGGTVLTANCGYSPRLATFGVTGDEYVWHCHILEHEEHDMMHSLVSS